jgi:hypothetical protein
MTISPYFSKLFRLRISFDLQLLIILFFYGVIKGAEYSLNLSFGLLTFAFFFVITSVYLILALLSGDNVKKAKGILFVAFIGNDYYFFFYGLIIFSYVFFSVKHLKASKFNLLIILFLFYAICISALNLVSEFFLLNFILSLILYSSFLLVPFVFLRGGFTKSDISSIVNFFECLIVLQIALILIQFVFDFSFHPGDWGRGSLDSTDKTGIFIFLYFIVAILIKPIVEKRNIILHLLNRWKYVLFLLLLSVFIDAKIIYVCLLFSLVLTFIVVSMLFKNIYKLISTNYWAISVSLIITFVFLLPFLAQIYNEKILNDSRTIESSIEIYYNDPWYSQKYDLYKRVFFDMPSEHPFQSIFGVGLGKFGGKVSNAFAKDVLYKDPENKLLSYLPTHSSQLVKEYYSGLYTEEIYNSIRYRSANLSFPFAGIITVKTELGLIGLFLFLTLIFYMGKVFLANALQASDTHIKRWWVGFSIYTFSIPVLMLFDNYHEFSQVMMPAFLFVTLATHFKDEP